MLISNFHYLRPYWFLALIPLGLIIFSISRQLRRAENWRAVCDEHLLSHLLTHQNRKQSLIPLLLLSIAWFIAIFALAGPTWSRLRQPVYQSLNARVIALDLSQSMLAKDIKPDRVVRAKYKVLDMLKKFHDGQTGMIAFTSEPYVVSPLTQDSRTIAAMVPVLSPGIMPVQGSNIGAALQKAADLFKQASAKNGTIFLLTDNTPTANDFTIARELNSAGYTISVMGIGTEEGAPIPNPKGGFVTAEDKKVIVSKIDTQALRNLATSGDGRYAAFTNSNQDLTYLLQPSFKQHLSSAKKTKAEADIWRDEGRWLILLLLPFALLAFRRGWMSEVIR